MSQSYQSKGSENSEASHSFGDKFDQWQGNDREIENVPPFLKVVFGAHCHQLDSSLHGKGSGEKLNEKKQSLIFISESKRGDETTNSMY